MRLRSSTVPSPVGPLKLVAQDDAIVAILWENDDPARVRLGDCVEAADHAPLREAERQLAAYFAGTLARFTLPVRLIGTPFQMIVWAALSTIPFGETRSYGAIARQIALPKASRAVGAAIGRNPISIVVPCHRVIGATGRLTGFAGGLSAKDFLLVLEGAAPLGLARQAPRPALDVAAARP